jgi:hypothetical protein
MVAATQSTQPQVATREVRMTLKAVTTGKVDRPRRILLHGVDGVGKTTFAAGAPKPIFLGAEEGTNHLDVARFPLPETLDDIFDAIRVLTLEPHDFETLAIDTLDWMEPIVWKHVCDGAKVDSIEDVGSGYGKGYLAALDVWRRIINAIERLQRDRHMHLVALAHSVIKSFKNPEGEDYDRYILKMNEKSASQWREWCDGVYFANYETFAKKDMRTKRVRGVSSGLRFLHTERTAAYDAKDRYGLPTSLPLSWDEFERAATAGLPVETPALVAEIKRKAQDLGGEFEQMTLEALGRFAAQPEMLSQLSNRLDVKIAEREQAAQ